MEGVGSVRFGHGVHFGGGGAPLMPGAGMIPAGMGSLLLGAGMPAAGGNMVQAGGYLASAAGYGGDIPNVMHAAWNGVAVAGGHQQPQAGGGNGAPIRSAPHRGPWTEEEDETLKALVAIHGERRWAVICKYLPGRIGKQCRERWTNHLRPDIDKAKSIWTEEDDLKLIESHKQHGNRWSVIARDLIGRSENSVKNHWNATKRSLRARRRLKKKKNPEAPPGQQWSILEQYIRSLQLAGADRGRGRGARAAPLPPPPADSPPSSFNTGYGEVVSPPHDDTRIDPAALGLYLSAAAGSNDSSSSAASVNLGAMNYMIPNVAPLPPPPYLGLDLNSYYYYYGAPLEAAMAPEMMGQDQQAFYSDSLITYHQFVDSMAWHSSVHAVDAYDVNSANAAHQYYYSDADAGAGPSGTTAVSGDANIDDVDVVGLASREFLSPSEEEVTLNLAGFM